MVVHFLVCNKTELKASDDDDDDVGISYLCCRNSLTVMVTLLTVMKGIVGSKPAEPYRLSHWFGLSSFLLYLCENK